MNAPQESKVHGLTAQAKQIPAVDRLLSVLSMPVGTAIGFGLSHLIFASFTSEVYRIPMVVTSNTIAWAWIVVAVAAVLSGLVVRRRLDTLDLVAVLKTRE